MLKKEKTTGQHTNDNTDYAEVNDCKWLQAIHAQMIRSDVNAFTLH